MLASYVCASSCPQHVLEDYEEIMMICVGPRRLKAGESRGEERGCLRYTEMVFESWKTRVQPKTHPSQSLL